MSQLVKLKKSNIFQTIDKSELTKDVKKAIKIISYKPSNVSLYGSYNLADQPYPSDIDVYEEINLGNNISPYDAYKKAAQIIRKIVRRISKTKGIYLGDVKMCSDDRFYEVFDSVMEGEFSPENVEDAIKETYRRGLLNKKDYDQLIDLSKKSIKYASTTHAKSKGYGENNDYTIGNIYQLQILEIIRNLGLMRWNQKELLKGKKVLYPNRVITMEQALSQCKYALYDHKNRKFRYEYHMVKIDLWIRVNEKLIEVTNLLVFKFGSRFDKSGDKKNKKETYMSLTLNPDPDLSMEENQIKNLKQETAFNYYSKLPKFHKPIKYAKRLFVLSKIFKDKKTGQKLVELWRSPLNVLSSIKSELGVNKDVLEKVSRPPIKDIKHQVDQMKLKLDRITDIKIPNVIYGYINKILKTDNKKLMVEYIEEIENIIKELIDPLIIKYLKAVDLWPAPKKYLDKKYYYLNW
jgi:hypothetical protein